MVTVTKQQVNYFIMGWLLVHPNGSSTVVDRAWHERLNTIQELVFAHIFGGREIDASFTPLAASCATATVEVFGRVKAAPLTAPGELVRVTKPRPVATTATPSGFPEIHHDAVPHSEDPWSSSFAHLSKD